MNTRENAISYIFQCIDGIEDSYIRTPNDEDDYSHFTNEQLREKIRRKLEQLTAPTQEFTKEELEDIATLAENELTREWIGGAWERSVKKLKRKVEKLSKLSKMAEAGK